MRAVLFAACVLALSCLCPPNVFATEKMASDTGFQCQHCHLDPSGGGELTRDGEAYFQSLVAAGDAKLVSTSSKIVRFLAGYLHIVFAVLWFGTILYVHIVLKPSYAEKGLPRGEKLVGIVSFWVVGLTGLVLANYRLDSWRHILDTRFGSLLAVKMALYVTMLVSAVFVIKIIGPRLTRKKSQEHLPGEPFSPLTLQGFNGREGKSCYFAYDGKVYDASQSRMWPGGEHMRRHSSGEDLTAALSLAPHGADVMERLPVVGVFNVQEASGADASKKVFYVVAYMNLVIVFLILFIIALWRWG